MKRGPKTEQGRARSMANLRPAWNHETAPRKPRPAGQSIREKINEMADWPEADVRAVAESPRASVAERSAAQQLILCLNGGAEMERTCNQTAGSPEKFVSLNVTGGLAHTVHDAMERMRGNPEARAAARRLGELMYGHDVGDGNDN